MIRTTAQEQWQAARVYVGLGVVLDGVLGDLGPGAEGVGVAAERVDVA